jgi:glutamate synthase domain-containing protein 3
VSVKLVSEPGVGVIAVGVAKAQADVIVISGNEGGTGASPLISVKHAGSPWEIGLTEAHQTLAMSGIRDRVILEVDGGIRTGHDVVVAALLGAERFGFGTLPLLALGCKMVRRCHENTCPVGIATQREDLRAAFRGSVDDVISMFRLLAEEVRRHLAALGARSLDEVIGRTDLLEVADRAHPVAAGLDALLSPVETRYDHRRFRRFGRSPVGEVLVADAQSAIASGAPVQSAYPVTNADRAVGTRLSGEIVRRHPDGLPDGTVRVRLAGTAGQSLGAFLCRGVEIHLDGSANDYVGKGLGGGRIAIVPRHAEGSAVPHGAGNAVLYGATGGSLFVAGTVGQRFAVRNSGAVAVVEGCSDHGCEYMTGGRVVILGPVGRNLGAGMTGGVVYVWDPAEDAPRRFSETAPPAARPDQHELEDLRSLIEAHRNATGSSLAARLIDDWDRAGARFWMLRTPKTGSPNPDTPGAN